MKEKCIRFIKRIALLIALSQSFMGKISAQENTDAVTPFQLSFAPGLGTNGTQSHLKVNRFSFNIIGGRSKGNISFEFGGIFNINTELTKGLQMAGIVNQSGKGEKSIQFAGIANINKLQEGGFQFAGISNMAPVGKVSTQMAGIVNIAEKVSVQIGTVNIAKKVKGIQLGLVNIAETCDGVPIGLVNIVKKNGKKEFELAFSDVLHTVANFKLGTDRFYTIFSIGTRYVNTPVQIGPGIGFGTQMNWTKGWSNQFELMGYSLIDDGKLVWWRKEKEVNLLTQLKLTASKEVSPHCKLFAGPVLNLTISRHTNPQTGKAESSLAPYTIWENKGDKTNLKSWVGFTAGVRF